MAFPHTYTNISVRGEQRVTQVCESNDGSTPDYDFGEDSARCYRKFYSPWPSVLNQTRLDILGQSFKETTATGQKYLSRFIPIPHPEPAWAEELFASHLKISGTEHTPENADAFGVQSFDEATLHVTYQSYPYTFLTNSELQVASGATFPDEASLLRCVTIDQQTGAKHQTLPAFGPVVWVQGAGAGGPTAGKPLTNTTTILLHEGDITLTWHDVPIECYPATTVAALIGKTNASAFGHANSVLGSRPAQTLVFGIPRLKLRRGRSGQLGYDVTYNLKYRPYGANKFYFAELGKVGGFYSAAYDRFGIFPVHPTADFNTAFRPE